MNEPMASGTVEGIHEPLIFGAMVGALVIWIIVAVLRRLRRMKGYERAVRAYLGKNFKAAYDETIMIRFYDHNMCAADAAREMVAASRNAGEPEGWEKTAPKGHCAGRAEFNDTRRGKEPRPDIPKLKINTIGEFDSDGKPIYWEFDGDCPTSVGTYLSEDWYLIGGYTIDELRGIKAGTN